MQRHLRKWGALAIAAAMALGLILIPLVVMECSKAFGLTKHHK